MIQTQRHPEVRQRARALTSVRVGLRDLVLSTTTQFSHHTAHPR
jgi:hypothetical protein